MRKLVLLFALVCVWSGYSQENQTTSFKKNEIKGNALMLVAGAFEVTYERLLNEESGVGVSLFAPFSSDFDTKFSISPFYRFYFGNKPASGFFVEGFGMLDSYTQEGYEDSLYSGYVGPEKDVTDFALGFGLGGKWVTKRGFLVEVNGGIGRNLFNSKDTDYQIVGRGGVSIGYRF